MFGIGKKIEIQKMDINDVYDIYIKDPDHHMIICVDEVKNYDDRHIDGAECFPLRLFKTFQEYYPEKDVTYYVYSLNAALSEKAAKELVKQGYLVYDLGSFVQYKGPEDGLKVKKKRRRKK